MEHHAYLRCLVIFPRLDVGSVHSVFARGGVRVVCKSHDSTAKKEKKNVTSDTKLVDNLQKLAIMISLKSNREQV